MPSIRKNREDQLIQQEPSTLDEAIKALKDPNVDYSQPKPVAKAVWACPTCHATEFTCKVKGGVDTRTCVNGHVTRYDRTQYNPSAFKPLLRRYKVNPSSLDLSPDEGASNDFLGTVDTAIRDEERRG